MTRTSELQVQVTQEDIDKGERGNCGGCPIALAVARAAFSPAVVAQEEHIYWRHPELPRWYRANTPGRVVDFMAAFDGWARAGSEGPGPVRPISFRLTGILLEEGRAP